MAAQERINQSVENALDKRELEAIHHEQSKEIERAHENLEARSAEKSKAEALENARHEVEQIKHETESKAPEKTAERHVERPAVSRRDSQKAAFDHIMTTAQSQMSAQSRAFSKVIHNPGVEKTSEALGSTVARPNAILSGAVFAFVLTLGVYLVARYYGYTLSGFESIGAFVLGWVIGIIYDFLKVMITGKKA